MTSATRPLARGSRPRKSAGHASGRPTRRASSSFGWREPGSASSSVAQRRASRAASSAVMAHGAALALAAGLERKIRRGPGRVRPGSASCDLGILVSVRVEQLGDLVENGVALDLGPVFGHACRARRGPPSGPLARRRCSSAESPRALGRVELAQRFVLLAGDVKVAVLFQRALGACPTTSCNRRRRRRREKAAPGCCPPWPAAPRLRMQS